MQVCQTLIQQQVPWQAPTELARRHVHDLLVQGRPVEGQLGIKQLAQGPDLQSMRSCEKRNQDRLNWTSLHAGCMTLLWPGTMPSREQM